MLSKYTLISSAERSWLPFSTYLARWTARIWLCRLTNRSTQNRSTTIDFSLS
jgi:hypothetical protein